jgi:hypothetical protein
VNSFTALKRDWNAMNDSENRKHSYLVTPLPVLSSDTNAKIEPDPITEDQGIWVSKEKIKKLNGFIRKTKQLKEKYNNLRGDYNALQKQYDLKKVNDYIKELKDLNLGNNNQARHLIEKIEIHLSSIIKD